MRAIGGEEGKGTVDAAARKRAAVETYSRHEATLRRTARRYSLCADDADEALQRALEILLGKAPTTDPRELIRWTQTVVKHEALAVRRERERILAGPAANADDDAPDWVAMIPSEADGPAERAERHELVSRSREALQALKPQELRALTLLAEGYSYREIGEITNFSATKINRCLAEGRERFRSLMASSADGSRCVEMGPRLSAFCDGEAAADEEELREHLRACPHCRATLRAYRAVPATAAALAPTLPLHRPLLERAHDAAQGLAARFNGGGGGEPLTQVAAAGGGRGVGMAALAKAMAICLGGGVGAAACVATGVVPAPLIGFSPESRAAPIERKATPTPRPLAREDTGVEYETAPQPTPETTSPAPAQEQTPKQPKPKPEPTPEPEPVAVPAAEAGAVEYTPPPPPPAPSSEPTSSATSSGGGDPAGEFGP